MRDDGVEVERFAMSKDAERNDSQNEVFPFLGYFCLIVVKLVIVM